MGLNNTISNFYHHGQDWTLPSPVLNISAFSFGSDLDEYQNTPFTQFPPGPFWTAPSGQTPFRNVSAALYVYNNVTYDLNSIQRNGVCEQLETSYKWGFSYLGLFVFLLLFTLWAVGMYVLWLDAFLNSRLHRTDRSLGMQRAILDKAAAMEKGLGDFAIGNLSDTDLMRLIDRQKAVGRISYDILDDKLVPPSRTTELYRWWNVADVRQWMTTRDYKRWQRQEKWWLLSWIILLVLTIFFIASPSHPPPFRYVSALLALLLPFSPDLWLELNKQFVPK